MAQGRLPLVSVIIPTFNNGHFIGLALESLFQQTYPQEKIEIIVVDDGSTDNTHEILEKYRGKISYVRQENKGIASARNTGMAHAKGEIITFLDADDVWHEERLQRVVEKFIVKPDIGIVYHPVELIDSDGLTIYKNFYKAFGYEEGLIGWVANEISSGRIFSGGSAFAFKKDIIDKLYPIPEDVRRGIDYYMTVISSCYAPAEYIPDILGKYRLHAGNVTMSAGQDNNKELSMINQYFAYTRQKVIDKILSLDSPNVRKVDLDIIKRIQAKEMIFYNVLAGKRLDGIKRIPSLFKGNPSVQDLLKGIAVSFLALFIPSFLYPKLVKVYGLLKRLKIIWFGVIPWAQ